MSKTTVKGKMISLLALVTLVGAGYWWLDSGSRVSDSNKTTYHLRVVFTPGYRDPGVSITVKIGASARTWLQQNSSYDEPVAVPHGTGLLLKVSQDEPGFLSCTISRNGHIVDTRNRNTVGELGCLTVA